MVVEIETGDSVVGLGVCGFFFERDDFSGGIELCDSVAFGIADMVCEYGCSCCAGVSAFEEGLEFVAVEDVIAENEG